MSCCKSNNTKDSKHAREAAERKQKWEKIRKTLPRRPIPEDKARRLELFKKFDVNNNNEIDLEEAYQGCVKVLHLDELTPHLRDIVKRAFNKAKDMGTKDRNAGDSSKVEFLEFRLMLCYIYDYFELTVMFDEIDTRGDMYLDKKEFVNAASKIEAWGVKMEDPAKTFKEIDGNGSGKVTFDEFSKWALAHKLDADGDPDNMKPK